MDNMDMVLENMGQHSTKWTLSKSWGYCSSTNSDIWKLGKHHNISHWTRRQISTGETSFHYQDKSTWPLSHSTSLEHHDNIMSFIIFEYVAIHASRIGSNWQPKFMSLLLHYGPQLMLSTYQLCFYFFKEPSNSRNRLQQRIAKDNSRGE